MERYFKSDKEFIKWLDELITHIQDYDTGDVEYYDKLSLSYNDMDNKAHSTYIWPISEDIVKVNMHNILGIQRMYIDITLLDTSIYDVYCDTQKRDSVINTYYILIEGNTDMMYFFESIFNELKSDKIYITFVVSYFGGLKLKSNLDYLMCNIVRIKEDIIQEIVLNVKDKNTEVTCVGDKLGVFLRELFMLLVYYDIKLNVVTVYINSVDMYNFELSLSKKYSDWFNPLNRLKMFKDYYTKFVFIADEYLFDEYDSLSDKHKNYVNKLLDYNNSSLELMVV